jgi:hypothetical protein
MISPCRPGGKILRPAEPLPLLEWPWRRRKSGRSRPLSGLKVFPGSGPGSLVGLDDYGVRHAFSEPLPRPFGGPGAGGRGRKAARPVSSLMDATRSPVGVRMVTFHPPGSAPRGLGEVPEPARPQKLNRRRLRRRVPPSPRCQSWMPSATNSREGPPVAPGSTTVRRGGAPERVRL